MVNFCIFSDVTMSIVDPAFKSVSRNTPGFYIWRIEVSRVFHKTVMLYDQLIELVHFQGK